MVAKIIDGKLIASKVKEQVSVAVSDLNQKSIFPGLATIIVGNDAASSIYVKNKRKSAKEVGIESFQYELSENIQEKELLELINELNLNSDVDGILVQLPLPKHINSDLIIDSIDVNKDVDGFNVINAGKTFIGRDSVIPCTPLGCLLMLKSIKIELKGKNAVIIGRSNIVGKPMAQLLLNEDCTVTIVHSKTFNIQALVKEADIVVAAVGSANLVKGSWIKKGAVVIDVGINRLKVEDKNILVGDINFNEVKDIASYITPVPGGVGPMTIACLLMNTVFQCAKRNNVSIPNNLKKLF
ncbi:MAG: bifunctional methylenetetrahydrofolate dehydrogenase/methenyltetrahydrofolate cyclohydrolase FolD [Alphaproteobacteria bacterium]|nr:bifunctional methylenetetrahydrofolate dehydrogenase/methenyltetrahydrofolate cyclohydrolase FolD [Alphaproteobacteria bacterium]|tara:strand:- start:38 stop:931 length:894 start_codon:yes stop_codon:yes gene_type:complete